MRDNFTIPKAEYEALEALKVRARKVNARAKKSEVLLRAGIMVLAGLPDAAFAMRSPPCRSSGPAGRP